MGRCADAVTHIIQPHISVAMTTQLAVIQASCKKLQQSHGTATETNANIKKALATVHEDFKKVQKEVSLLPTKLYLQLIRIRYSPFTILNARYAAQNNARGILMPHIG